MIRLVRLYARRDRMLLASWIVVAGLIPAFYASSIGSLYATDTARRQLFTATRASASERALVGPIYGDSLGALTAWRSGAMLTVMGILALLMVIRHTRAEEDAGRSELIASTAVGRYAGLMAALSVTAATCVLTGIVAGVGLVGSGLPIAGSAAFALGFAAVGVVFSGVGAVAAQVGSSARSARGIGLGVLAVAFVLRAAGSWLSPLHWSDELRPFAGNRWWVLVIPVFVSAALVGAACVLRAQRDLGSGLVAERVGRANAAIKGPLGLAWRLQRGSIVSWIGGLAVLGFVLGGAADGIGSQLGSGTAALTKLGGSDSISEAFLSAAISLLAIVAAAFGISSVLRLRSEELSGRAEVVLAGPTPRMRFVAGHLWWALAGSAAAMAAVGLTAGVAYGVAIHDVSQALSLVMADTAVQIPAVWTLCAVGVFIFGTVPRAAAGTWIVLIVCVVLGQIGVLLGLPHLVLDLSPFAHVAGPGRMIAAAVLVVVSGALAAAGTVMFRRRDLQV